MSWKSSLITGLWSRRIKRLPSEEDPEGKEVEYMEVKVDATTMSKLLNVREGDYVQVWVNDHRNNDNSPTHQMRVRTQVND